MRRNNEIGFSQRIQLSWLSHTANLAMAGQTKEEIEQSLQELLREQLSIGGAAKRGTREKAITILMKIWVTVPENLRDLRNRGLALLRLLRPRDRLCVHWGMSMAVYPFWGHVAASTGRLLRLQGTAGAAQVQRRIRETYGERETVSRAVRRVLRTFVDWGVLLEAEKKGLYRAAKERRTANGPLTTWLVEAALIADGAATRSLQALLQSPSLFPIELQAVTPHQLSRTRHFEVAGYTDGEWVQLRRSPPT